MKLLSWMAGCALLTALGTGTLAAQPISVQVNGHLTQWVDTTGQVGPYLPWSVPVTAIYTYDTNGQMLQDSYDEWSLSASVASLVVTAGPFTFQTGPATHLEAVIDAGNNNWGQFGLQGFSPNPPLPNGLTVDHIGVFFFDLTGQWPTSSGLPAGAPSLTDFSQPRNLPTHRTNQLGTRRTRVPGG